MYNKKLSTVELVIFSMLGSIMYMSKILMEWIPNVHLLGVLIITYTIVYRKKAVIIVYIYVLIVGASNGFSPWWISNLYTWAFLWLMAMAVPVQWPDKRKIPAFMLISGMHGIMYGTLCAPVQAVMFGLNLEGTIAWIIAGIPFDITHGISNFSSGIIIIPLAKALQKLENIRK